MNFRYWLRKALSYVMTANDARNVDLSILRITKDTTGGHEEYVTNPKGEVAKSLNSEFINRVEVGFLLEFEDSYLCAFCVDNGFNVGSDRPLKMLTAEDLKQFVDSHSFYQLT